MKAVILAGGLGTRLGDETRVKPKPMIEIGGLPLLWHIQKIFEHHGVHEFVICHGIHGQVIKDFYAKILPQKSETKFCGVPKLNVSAKLTQEWVVEVVDTGDETMTGGRIRRAVPYIGDEEFFMTYGDGVGNVDIRALLNFHREKGKLATVTAVRPPARFGALYLEGGIVRSFQEHSVGEAGWINGGFFVLSPQVLKYIEGDAVSWELEPMARLIKERELAAFQHAGFWRPMDTLRDKNWLEELWKSGKAPWRLWP